VVLGILALCITANSLWAAWQAQVSQNQVHEAAK